jgi:hypothetical protein
METPGRLTSARSLVDSYLESSPFDKKQANLEYRPYSLNGRWSWFWVLNPVEGGRALQTGDTDSRAKASIQARIAARKLNRVIAGITTKLP